MKKRFLAVVMMVVLVLTMCACQKKETSVEVRVGSLKGPTSMGILKLMEKAQKGETTNQFDFTMETGADTLLPLMLKGEMDIALVPANVAAILYQKSEGNIQVIDINTLGVLYMVSSDTSITTIEDLKGKTIYLTGKGTTPDYVLQYLLKEHSISKEDVIIEYKSEATEVAAILAENPESVGLLPQPFVTVALAKNEALQIVLDTNKEWNALNNGSMLVTGVTVVRKSFLEEHPSAVEEFMKEHQVSAAFANENVEETAELVAAAGIIEKAPVAMKALPYCNITYIDGADMKTALSGYLSVLSELDPATVGGALPEDNFYAIME